MPETKLNGNSNDTGNPIEAILKACNSFAHSFQSHLSHLFPAPADAYGRRNHPFTPVSPLSVTASAAEDAKDHESKKNVAATPTREELGRATWTLLHTIGAQFPEQPTRQQKRDAKELMAILSRIYPCKECADHFKEVLQANPVQAGSQAEFCQWLCHVHNVVNRSLGKPIFPCQRVNARWVKMDCQDRGCDLEGASEFDS